MPGHTRNPLGNILFTEICKNETLTGATSSAASFNQTIPLVGITKYDIVEVYPPSIVTGVCVGTVVPAANSLTVQWMNTTGGSVTTPSASVAAPYLFKVTRQENAGFQHLPRAIV
jgi:hypothetical protein